MITISEYRRKAREVLRPIFHIALLTALLAQAPGLVSRAFNTLRLQPLTEAMTVFAEADPTKLTLDMMLDTLKSAWSPAMIPALVLTVLAAVVTPVLTLGWNHFSLKLIRGQEADTADVLSRRGAFLKSIGLSLLILLKTILWMLPGAAVSFLGIPIVLLNPNMTTLNLMMVLSMVGSVIMMVLGIRAVLHYIMADWVLADDPSLPVTTALRRSVDMMRTLKGPYLLLCLSFIGWSLLAALVQSLFGQISPIIGMTLGMACDLAVAVYMHTAQAAFYEDQRPKV